MFEYHAGDMLKIPAPLRAAQALLIASLLVCAGCSTTRNSAVEGEPPVIAEEPAPQEQPAPREEPAATTEGEEEVPLSVVEPEHPPTVGTETRLPGVIVEGRIRDRHEVIHDLVVEAQAQLHDVELHYVFTGKGRREVLRGRPVAFALWSEARQKWTIAQIEIPRPPIKWRPGGRPMPFRLLTPGIKAQHVKGTGAERLMFSFSRGDEPLKVYGRKFPVFDNTLIRHKRWRAAVETAKPIVYLPFTDDTLDPAFVQEGREFLLSEARKAGDDLRLAKVPSRAFPGELLADVVPAEVITTLAVIEQMDDLDFQENGTDAVDEVLNQYGLKRQEAYRYSVSRASALGPMQFTNRRGNGTYALVVRRCPGAGLDPKFERGATNLPNAMKAAICLLDIELAQMREEIRTAYRTNPVVLGIFPVAAYNGGPRNVAKLHRALERMRVRLDELRRPGEQLSANPVACPCVWTEDGAQVRPVAIPRYNRENRWYIEKYQHILGQFESPVTGQAIGADSVAIGIK